VDEPGSAQLAQRVSPLLKNPDSRSHSSPVSSPLPLRRWQPAKSGCAMSSSAYTHAPKQHNHAYPHTSNTLQPWVSRSMRWLTCGRMAVTPVRTGPLPLTHRPSPSISVTHATRTPATSLMAFRGPVGNLHRQPANQRRSGHRDTSKQT
jgi:hypothetical protein